jgi:hypothetical protein
VLWDLGEYTGYIETRTWDKTMATDNPLIYSNANNNSIMYLATVYNLLLFFSHANCYLHTSVSLLNVNTNADLYLIV